jgi:MoxR-like ATPase
MTNNSEKSLPDAFLRRCIYYNISFPTGPRLEQIVMSRLPEFVEGSTVHVLARDAVDFLLFIREESSGLEKRPGTAELLNWISGMARLGARPDAPLGKQADIAERAFPALAKISSDQIRVRELLWSWKDGRHGA